jgi:hypothetical protein
MSATGRTCARCSAAIDGMRVDAAYCGGSCRAAASRERRAGVSDARSAGQARFIAPSRTEAHAKRLSLAVQRVRSSSSPMARIWKRSWIASSSAFSSVSGRLPPVLAGGAGDRAGGSWSGSWHRSSGAVADEARARRCPQGLDSDRRAPSPASFQGWRAEPLPLERRRGESPRDTRARGRPRPVSGLTTRGRRVRAKTRSHR